ncbi:MAG: ABC transporter permease [Planctomycetes bacterium]|nr:ABC transporter permease [Planctomycetota bacterium]
MSADDEVAPGGARWLPLALVTPAAALLLVLFLAPLALLVRVSLYRGGGRSGFGVGGALYEPGTWSLQAYAALRDDPYAREVLGFTVALGVGVTGLCLAAGYPLAYLIHRQRGPLKTAAVFAVVLPKLANLLVVLYGLKLLLREEGPVAGAAVWLGLADSAPTLHYGLAAVVLGKTYLVVPYTTLIILAGLERLDPALVEAARGLGATPWQAFARVTLPLSLPSVRAAALVSFIWALGAFASPALLGSPDEITLAVDVQRQAFENLNWPRAAAEAVLMLVTLGLCVALAGAPGLLARRGAR